ncbi:related to UPC2 - regulatory protein involved in control of sterol uptake [Fusarium torulosum]|uniref:Related to UPC2 - regulatory protein involved in control of sterol uptake n=1 Tax=Fusarium torulosum TaxID=33205 RepID=A0AAE8M2W0_9HYPO|nr:related to UPC2 - regulatory protein involved in control of sterol uptake [Fusarium torulosum]
MDTEPHDAIAIRSSGAKPRRAHKKAKTGCADCRKRRVKCSEEKPMCRACCRRGVQCQYPSFQTTSLSAAHSPATDEASPYSSSTQLLAQDHHISPIPGLAILRARSREPSSARYGIEDMALLHHWTVSTSLDIYKNSSLSVTCQVTFPQVAFRYPFVMQALLGLTALHIAYLEPQERLRHTADAARYHNEGLQGFNKAIQFSDDETADSLFIWSSLNLLYVFGISGRLGEGIWDDSGWGNRKDRILGMGWIPMLRGVQTVSSPSFYTLRDGPLGELLSIGNWEEIDPDKVLEANDQRFCLTREAWINSPDAPIYEKTLQVLRKCRIFMAQFSSMNTEAPQEAIFNRSWQGAFLFVPFAPEEYFTLLQQRQPPALILYAFYGALLHALNDSWFMEGWGYDIVEVVDDLLGPYWKQWISWPLEVVGLYANK